jgi:hypothetical protein
MDSKKDTEESKKKNKNWTGQKGQILLMKQSEIRMAEWKTKWKKHNNKNKNWTE